MFLDDYISYQTKTYISMMIGGLWIYFRELKDYDSLPRKNIISVFLVTIWIYLNYQEPLFLPIGLGFMVLYSRYYQQKSKSKIIKT